MIEYAEHLDVYSHEFFFTYARHIKENEWGNKAQAETYLSKYWLLASEYEESWKPKKQAIFTKAESLPALIFNENYEMLVMRGGLLFSQDSFELLQRCMNNLGEKYFVVIENDFLGTHPEPMLRMKFPWTITWEELMSGNFISTILFEMHHNEYYLIGESDNWGRYSANEAMWPLNIIGFKSEYGELFRKYFIQPEEEWQEIKEWLPPLYKSKIHNI